MTPFIDCSLTVFPFAFKGKKTETPCTWYAGVNLINVIAVRDPETDVIAALARGTYGCRSFVVAPLKPQSPQRRCVHERCNHTDVAARACALHQRRIAATTNAGFKWHLKGLLMET